MSEAAYPPPPTIDISGTTVPPNPGVSPNPGVPRPTPKDPTAAVLLEILPAICLQTFGIGNIYAGNVLGGILIMLGYWISTAVNVLLCFILIGFITWPLTFLAFGFCSSYLAYQKAKATQLQSA